MSQFVDNQMIMKTPRDELKFILDNQGCNNNEIQLRITEITSYLGIIDLLDNDVNQLSGGQKQLVNLASSLILKPQVLLLDEPTSQLDPIASEKLLQVVHKLNEQLNMTIILVEHDINQEIHFANRFLVMEKGQIILDESVNCGLNWLYRNKQYKNYLTQVDRLYLELGLGDQNQIPLSNKRLNQVVRQSQTVLQSRSKINAEKTSPKVILEAKKLSFRYGFNEKRVVDNISFKLNSGMSYCVVGPNGMGKTTLMNVLTQQLTKQAGSIKFKDKKNLINDIFVLPQNPMALFMKDTVEEELIYQLQQDNSSIDLDDVLNRFSLIDLRNISPYEISGGQQELLALALGFIKNPQILFLDEPTKGLDPNKRILIGEMLRDFQNEGGTVFANSHDLLFAAEYFDKVAMMFDGKLSEFSDPDDFFTDKFFYTTEINKAVGDVFPKALSWKDIQKIEP